MRKLLKSDTKFIWSEACNVELQDLKQTLTNPPILSPFRNDRPTFLYVDGAISGMGSCAIQFDNNNVPHVCAYMSLATTDSQKKWTTAQLETAALGMALRQNETIFLHNTIHVFTDNASVLHIHRYKPTNSREKRLISYISQFDLHIHYIPGRNNKLADCLSRLPEDIQSSDVIHFQPSDRLKEEDFLLPITEMPTAENPSDTAGLQTESPDTRLGEWIGYKIEIGERTLENNIAQTLNPEATEFVPHNLSSSLLQDQPTRRSARIAARKARLQTSDRPQNDESSPPSRTEIVSDLENQNEVVTDMTDTTHQATQSKDEDRTTNDILTTWAQKPVTNFDETDDEMTAEQITHMTNRPDITAGDYLDDDYFRPIYEYLRDDKLTGMNDTDRKTILMSENYYLESDLLYKVTPTRGRKEKRISNSYEQLCIPQKYVSNLLKEWHSLLGHYSSGRLLPTCERVLVANYLNRH